MKNLFSKTLLCGVLATSFVLINCQKAPARKVTPDANQYNKPGSVAKSGPCVAATVTAYDAAKTALDALTADIAKPNPNAAELSAKLDALKKLIDAAKAAIATSHKDGADECVKENKEDPKKNATLKIEDFAEGYTKLSKFIAGLGGTVPAEALAVGNKIELSEAAAALFTNPANGCGALGKDQSTAKCEELKADPKNTICSFAAPTDKKPVASGAKGAITAMNPSEDKKSLLIVITLDAVAASEGVEADTARLVEINCALGSEVRAADKAAGAATAALGVLVKKVAAVEQPAQEPIQEPAQEPASPAASTPAPASDALAADAQGALNLLDEKAAPAAAPIGPQ